MRYVFDSVMWSFVGMCFGYFIGHFEYSIHSWIRNTSRKRNW